MTDKIILKGYYGFANLGDDILLKVTYQLVKECFPDSEILVCSNSAFDNSYIISILGESVRIIKDDDPIKANWIVDGGGGVYFDFKKGNLKFYLLNTIIHLLGFTLFKSFYRAYRSLKRNTGITSIGRIGLGIGVGSYTYSSARFFNDIISLSDYDFLLVRDEESAKRIIRYGFSYTLRIATDLAFLKQYWLSDSEISGSERNCVGFILRDWSYDNQIDFDAIEQTAQSLQRSGIPVLFFSFDGNTDRFYKERFSNFSMIEWNPERITVTEFVQKLKQCKLIVTSRAHGAILSACLNIPSVCLAIEEKLVKVSEMLAKSSVLIQMPIQASELTQVVLHQFRKEGLEECVREDVRLNQIVMEAGIVSLKEFLKGN
ncbi:MAG: polysaccharide pyruvyl transferase family protein [Cyclobacteriaceae bacterium]|nr:polysaccharide pyruvyl transferase family protein [Cyclobacteriaceae bacterium]UYN87383.1 MAG: polysaccharide pyruvyl transferase family protein [Cyclobacteriaceae bacterium]